MRLIRMLAAVVLTIVAVAACSETRQEQTIDLGDPPPDCPSYSAADLDAARAHVVTMVDPDGNEEPFVVVASQRHPFAMVVVRHSGEVRVISDWADGDDQGLALLVQPGDSGAGDLIWDDTALEDVELVEKQVVTIAGCPAVDL